MWAACFVSGCCRVGATECRGRTLFACEDDLRGGSEWKEQQTCGAVCVTSDDEAFCAESAERDPACDATSPSTQARCEGTDLVKCRGGYLTAPVTSCSACVELPGSGPTGGVAVCALSSGPEPGCSSTVRDQLVLGCFDDDIVVCWNGAPLIRQTVCDEGTRCREATSTTPTQVACLAD